MEYVINRAPGLLHEGNVIHDKVGQRTVEITEIHAGPVEYYGVPVMVWFVRGVDTRPDLNGTRDVRMVLVPRIPVPVVASV